MKVTNKKNDTALSCDELPMPVIIHRQDNGLVLKCNREARKILDLPAKGSKTLTIDQIRPDKLVTLSSKSKNFIDYGPVLHRTSKGKDIKLIVLRKAMTWNDVDCFIDILENANDALAVKNEIIRTSLDAFVSINKEQVILDWNSSAEKIFGWKRKEVIGRKLVDLIIPRQYRKQHNKGFRLYLKTGKGAILNKIIEVTALNKEGHEFPIELTITPVKEFGNQLFYSFIRDISERKLAEQTLRESEFKLKKAQSLASIGSWEMLGDFNELYWSDEFYHLHGLNPQSVKPSMRLRLSMVHPQDRTKLKNAIEAAAKLGKPYAMEKRILLPNGKVRWVLSQGESAKDGISGKRKVFGTLLDITTRKENEEKQHYLHQSLADFQNAIQSSSIVSRADNAGLITYVNQNFVNISGFNEKELIGQNHRLLNSGYHPKSFWADLWKTIASGQIWKGEIKNKTKDGNYYWVDAFIMPFLDLNGKVKEFLSILNDITVRKQSEEVLAMSHANLSETLVFGKMGSVELDLQTLQLWVSKELFLLLDEEREPVDIPLENFLKTYVSPESIALVQTKVKEGMVDLRNTKKIVGAEFEMITAKGRKIWIEGKGIFKGTKALGILQDITERKNAAEMLIRSEHKHRRLYNNVPAMYFTLDDSLQVKLVNTIGAAQLGYIPSELIGESVLKVFPHEVHDVVIKQVEKCFAKPNQVFHWEIEKVKKDGSRMIVRELAWIEPDVDNKPRLNIICEDITEQKIAEDKLQASERKFRALIENNNDAIVLLNREGRLQFQSPSVQKILGYSQNEINEKSFFEFYHPDETPVLMERFEDAMKNPGKAISYPSRLKHKNGHYIWAEGSITNLFDDENVSALVGNFRDVTERKEAQLKLEESETHLRAILNASTDSTIFVDTQGKIRVANKIAIEGIKQFYTNEFALGDSFADLLPSENKEDFLENFAKTIKGESLDFERQVQLPHETIWIHLQYLPVINNQNQIIGISQNVTNITTRKLAEEALKQSEERFRFLYNNTPVMMHSIDQHGRLVRVSDYWLQKMEYTREEVLGKPSINFLSKESQKKAVEVMLPEFFAMGEVTNVEYSYVTKSGKILDTLLSARCEYDDLGRIIRSLAVVTDITEKKKLEQEVEKLARIASRTSNLVILTDIKGCITWVNEGFEKISGYNKEEVIGKKPGDFLQGPETDKATVKQMHEAIASGEGFKVEILNYSKTGKSYWLDIEVMPVHDDGKLTGFMAIESDITPLKLALSEMRNSEVRLKTMMDNAPMAVFMKDLEGLYTFYNESYEKVLSHIQMKHGVSDYDFFDNAVADFYFQKDKEVFETCKPVSYETEISKRQYLTTKFPIRNQLGQLCALGGISIDITERKQLEESVRESEYRLRSMIDTEPNCVKVLGTKGELLDMNTSGLEMIEADNLEQVLGKPMINLVDKPFRSRFNELIRSVLSGNSKTLEFAITGLKGKKLWLETHAVPFKDQKNNRTLLLGITRDITFRKESENLLRESEERFRIAADSAPVLIWMAGEDKLCNYFNKGWLDFTGRTLEQEISKGWTEGIHPDDLQNCLAFYTSQFDLRQEFSMEFRLKRNDGEYRWIMNNGTPRYLQDGQFVGYIGSCFDITERKKSEKALLTSNREKDALIKEIHHRVKNNLQLISSILYIRMNRMKESALKDFLEDTRQKIRSIALIHERLLQTGSVNEVDIADYLSKLITDLHMSHAGQGLIIDSQIESEKMNLDMAIYCGLVINELVTNAIKHAFVNRTNGRITILLHKKEGMYQLIVYDDGTSMPQSIGIGQSGTFGMQLLDIFIKQLNGSVEINRENGTRFTISFRNTSKA